MPDYSDPSSPSISVSLHPIGGAPPGRQSAARSSGAHGAHMTPSLLVLFFTASDPLAGFCAVSKTLPLPAVLETETATSTVRANGLRAEFGEKIFCVAAEPHATFLRVGVIDVKHEPAYTIAVLGRIKPGYRVLQMRNPLGTHIELCFLLVRVHFDSLRNIWPSVRQVCAVPTPTAFARDGLSLLRYSFNAYCCAAHSACGTGAHECGRILWCH